MLTALQAFPLVLIVAICSLCLFVPPCGLLEDNTVLCCEQTAIMVCNMVFIHFYLFVDVFSPPPQTEEDYIPYPSVHEVHTF